MNRKWGKKWMAAMLSISMVIGMFPGVGNPVRVLADEPPGQAVTQADTSNADNSGKDKYGFNLTTPSSFNANDGENPYGSGYSAFNEKMEAFLWYRSSGKNRNAETYNYTKSSDIKGYYVGPDSKRNNNGFMQSRTASGAADVKYVNVDGYDPYGTGRDNMVALVGASLGKDPQLVVARYSASGKGQELRKTFSLGSGDDNDWLRDNQLEKYSAYKNYFTLKAGDFDGDGDEDIAVYVPKRGDPYIMILDGITLSPISDNIPVRSFMGNTGADMAGKFTNNGKTARATINMSIETSDINRDGKDEILLVGSYSNIHDDSDGKKLQQRSSVFACYKVENKKPQQMNKYVMDKDTCSVYMRYASVAAGDIDFDGFPEVVVAGVYSDNDGPDGDKSGSNKKYMLVTLKYDPNEEVETLIPSGGNVMDMCNFVNAGFDKDDNVHPLPALTCAAVNGRNDAEQVFLDGVFWKFENESWKKDYTAKVCQSSDKGIGGYIISDTWVDGCVAGNFDENDLGIEQVLYTTGYKQQSFNRYFYRVNMSGKEQNKDSSTGICTPGSYFDSSSNELVRHVGMSDFPCLAIAAVDADKDTDVFTFKSKKYTYSNVDILAILQAAPYFGELQDNYYNGNIGETLYGKLSGQGTVTSKTKMASIGAYASFSIGSSALQFHTEASYTHDWEWSYEDELSHEYSISFENDGTKNQVVLYRTPVILYEYVITPANGSASYTMEVGVQQQPVYSTMDVDTFNRFAESDETLQNKVITKDILSSTPGCPDTYATSSLGMKGFVGYPNWVEINNKVNDQTTVAMNITDSTQSSKTMTQTNSFELTLGVEGEIDAKVAKMNYGGGVKLGGGWGSGKTTFDYSSVSKEGVVAYPPATDSQYSFSTKFGIWQAKLGDNNVPILGFVVKNVEQPPSPPEDISVDTVTADYVTLAWESGYKKAEKYEIYQVFNDGITTNKYSLLDTISGDSSSYTYDGLKPSTEYEFALRSVGTNSGGETVYSEYTPEVSVHTLADSEKPDILSMTSVQRVVVGGNASFVIDALPSANAKGGLSYAWQVRKAGSVNWVNLTDKEASGINGSTLKLNGITEDMDGNSYRCVLSELIKGVRLYAYGAPGILHVGRADSMMTATISNTQSDSANKGTNTAFGQYTQTRTVTNERTVSKTVAVTIGTQKETFVQYKNGAVASAVYPDAVIPEFIYFDSQTNEWYVLEGYNETAGTATAKVKLNEVIPNVFQSGTTGDAAALWNGVDADTIKPVTEQVTETAAGKTYYAYTAVTADGEILLYSTDAMSEAVTQWYQLEQGTDGAITAKAYAGTVQSYVPAYAGYKEESAGTTNQQYIEVDGTTWYLYWPEAYEGNNAYIMYAKSAEADRTADETYYYKTEQTVTDENQQEQIITTFNELKIATDDAFSLMGSGASKQYGVTPGEVVTVNETYDTQVEDIIKGDQTTVQIHVAEAVTSSVNIDKTGIVNVNFFNNRTGSIRDISTDVDKNGNASVVWNPEEAGDYTVTVSYGGNTSLYPTDTQTVYYVVDRTDNTVYVLSGNNAEYGNTIKLEVRQGKRENDTSGNITTEPLAADASVSYQVSYVDGDDKVVTENIASNTFTPKWPGQHTFVATITRQNGTSQTKSYAMKMLTVSKRPIVITAPSKDGISEDDTADKVLSLSDVVVKYAGDDTESGILDSDAAKYKLSDLMTIEAEPKLDENSTAGVYQTGIAWLTVGTEEDSEYIDLVKEFLKKYNVTLNRGKYQIVSNQYTVRYESDGKGTIKGYCGDSKEPFASGTGLADQSKVSFKAIPKDNYKVKAWKVTGSDGNDLVLGTDYVVNGDTLIISALSSSVHVSVSFAAKTYQLNYDQPENGSLQAYYVKAGSYGSKIDTGETVLTGKSILLQAVPDENYVVKQWTVSHGGSAKIQKNTDGSIFAGTEIILDNVETDTVVAVEFEPVETYLFETEVIAEDPDTSVAGCKINVSEQVQDGKAAKGSTVTLTADLPESVIVSEWRIYTDDIHYTVAATGGDQYVVSNVQKNMKIKLVVNMFQMETLHFEAVNEQGQQVDDVVTAWSDSVQISNDTKIVKNLPVVMKADVPEQYQISAWKLFIGSEEQTIATGKDAKESSFNSVNKSMRVVLVLLDRPTVTYNSDNNGTLECDVVSGGYIDRYHTEDIVMTAAPKTGYEVDQITVMMDGAAYSDMTVSDIENTDNKQIKIQAPDTGFEKNVEVAVTYKEIPKVELQYELVSADGAKTGTIAVHVDRKKQNDLMQDVSAGSGSLEVYRDSTVTMTASVIAGYEINAWSMNGTDITADVRTNNTDLSKLVCTVDEKLLQNAPIKIMVTVVKTPEPPLEPEKPVVEELTKKQIEKNSQTLSSKQKVAWTQKGIQLTWKAVKGAQGYDVYAAPCNRKKLTVVKTISGAKKNATVLSKYKGKSLNRKQSYRVRVKAYRIVNGKKQYIATGLTLHIAGPKNKTYTNVKKIQCKKTEYTLKKGKTAKITTKLILQDNKKKLLSKGHGAKLRYSSTNKAVAVVTAKGTIRAKKKGTCYIYVTALNGVNKRVKVTVK